MKIQKALESKQSQLEAEILKKHKITKDKFEYSLSFYTEGITHLLHSEGYPKDESAINLKIVRDLNTISDQESKLFPPPGKQKMFFRGVERPDFEIEIPADFTAE